MGYVSRAGAWGTLEGSVPEYIRFGDRVASRVAMIEDESAVEDIDGILASDGIDAVFVGPGDLSASMGVSPSDERVRWVTRHVIACSSARGSAVGTVADNADEALARQQEGCAFVLIGSDARLLAHSLRDAVSPVRAALAAAHSSDLGSAITDIGNLRKQL